MSIVPSPDLGITLRTSIQPPARVLGYSRRLPARRLDGSPPPVTARVVDLLRAFDTARGRSARLAARIPESALDWAAAPTAFTCADLVRHLASAERFVFTEIAMGGTSRYPGCDRSVAYGKEGVLAYLDAMHEESMAMLQTLDNARLERRVTTPSGAQIPTWRWLQLMTEHEAHYRGQIALMLRLLGIDPPSLFGLAEAELLGTGPARTATAS